VGAAVGIDLGTTYSAVAHLDAHGRPQIVPNELGDPTTPSVLCFKGDEILVGEEAKEYQALGLYPVAFLFKRAMGDRHFVFRAGGRDWDASQLSAVLLKKLVVDASASLGEAVTQAVITVPAYFRDPERKATIAAGREAGLDVLQVINEPTAAAMAYGLRFADRSQRLLVYDLGGGTFDVTLLDVTGEGIRVITSDGDHQLGGKDWDDRIVEFLGSAFEDEFGEDPLDDAEGLADLLHQAETAKRKLSTVQSTSVSITSDGNRGRYQLDRGRFEQVTRDLMERTATLTSRVLEDKRLAPADIDGVLLVGGSTRMPMVSRFVQERFGRPALGGVNPDQAIALGAAIVAGERASRSPGATPRYSLGGLRAFDVTNHSLGMIALNADASAYVNTPIVVKDTAIPCVESRPYQHRTRSRGANEIEVYVTQGEGAHPGDVAYLGRHVIHDVPHTPGGMTVVDVSYAYDESGTVGVTARARGEQGELRATVEPLPDDVPDRFLRPPEPVEIPQHLTVYLAFDVSGSMSGTPMAKAKDAARSFVKNLDLSSSSVGIIAFSDSVRTKLEATQNGRAIGKAIDDLTSCETGVCNAAHPFDEILRLHSDDGGRRFAVVLADGMWSCQPDAVRRAKVCHGEDIDVVAIGFGGADKAFLADIASTDEGSVFTDLGGLVETFSTIAQVMTESAGRGLSRSGSAPSTKAGGRLSFLRRKR
jgi:molecular chaperone DnaK